MDIPLFIAKWTASGSSERANKDSFLLDLCEVLGVPEPDAKTGDPDRDRYVFEREAILVHGGERHSVGFIDGSRRGDVAAVLEALAALGILLAFDTASGRRWRAA